LQQADSGEDGAHHRAFDLNLGQLEGDGTDVADDVGIDFDQFELGAGQRPVDHRLGQFTAPQEGGQVVSQRLQLQPDLVVAESPARPPHQVEGVFAFLDVLLGGAALIVEADMGTVYPRPQATSLYWIAVTYSKPSSPR